MDTELRRAVLDASCRTEVRDSVASIYDQVERAVETRQPTCRASGKCCRFEEYGHRLYITTMELAKFVFDIESIRRGSNSELRPSPPRLLPVLDGRGTHDAPWDGTGCPFQSDGLCGVRAVRPFGCRLYFCDPTSTAWQQDLYERLHDQMRQAHDDLQVPYHYVEWRFALRTLGLTER